MNFKGIHHVSAMTAKAAQNYDFYTKTLGMRLIKKTVNQDDPSVYHLFYGDEKGNPGTELTFFEIPNLAPNKEGVSSISALSLRVPSDASLQYWVNRFDELQVTHGDILERAGRKTLEFRDYENQRFFLVSDEQNSGVAGGIPWKNGPIPLEHAIIGLGPVQLTVRRTESTVRVLTELMGFRLKGQFPSTIKDQPDVLVFETGEGGTGAEVHIEERTDLPVQRLGRGGVHHVAFRVDDEEELYAWINKVNESRFQNSGFVDRFYFKSLYFREPNGILFELATDGPGFDTDEHIDHLGESLALPPFLEPQREQIEARLKPLDTKLDANKE
ncbi:MULTISPECIES: ring-cleaving dioxygenase [Bacillaceae]|uniref:ring-cleaving dioxygenase n=2 Tax=Bacillales TaxID=1385 RepID=UPI001E36AAF7|nr:MULTISPECIES: ring-cleaving dioxygenase [Bacillaceae]MCE4047763.1 ring-cleaving dioxygenase [Bacillus sp. Au-Bac7]MDL0434786.1 ring-cleaving dioxygenase [Niallia sp. SS-2023]UPO89392.1 ring-cleaving dioxygenase [Niallia sp. Man26]